MRLGRGPSGYKYAVVFGLKHKARPRVFREAFLIRPVVDLIQRCFYTLTMKTIKQGDVITLKAEFQDAGDNGVTFRATENEDGGRFKVAAEIGLAYNPVQVIRVDWVATVNGEAI